MASRETRRPPDGEIAANAVSSAAPEFRRHPPEFAAPGGGSSNDARMEYTAPPPEYPAGLTTTEEAPRERSRHWRKLIAAALVSVAGFSFFGGKLQKSSAPTAEPVPGEEISAAGDVELRLDHAVLLGGTVYYDYYPFFPDPQDPTKNSGDIPLPIDVYARVTDSHGGSAAPENEPDTWLHSRASEEYEIDAAGLEGELTLTLTALYVQDGTERKTVQSFPVTVMDEEAPAFEIGYALTDGKTVYYSYFINLPDNSLPDEEQPYWPITVHPLARSEEGVTYYGAEDVWEYARASQFAYEIPLTDEISGSLTLELNGTYEKDGEACILKATAPVGQMPAAEALAFLYVQDDGTADFKAAFTTAESDEHFYDLEPMMLWAEAFDAERQRIGGFWSPEDLSVLAYESFEESGNKEYVLHCMEAIDGWPENAKYCTFRCYVRDRTNGYIYQLESNLAKLPAKTYPLGDEIIELTVYNDTLTFDYASLVDDPGWVTILVKTQLSAADFTDYELPLPLVPVGYRGTGYVVFFGSPFDNGYDAYGDYGGLVTEPPELTEDFSGEMPVEFFISKRMFAFPVNGLTLTKEMVERVPIAEDGVRYVNVHATWAITTATPEFYVELDDGQGSVTSYPVAHPLASEGFFYTLTFPQPETPIGYFFDGWYDESGNRVDYLMDYFSFTPYLYDENGKYVDYDWGSPKTVRLIAHWLPY